MPPRARAAEPAKSKARAAFFQTKRKTKRSPTKTRSNVRGRPRTAQIPSSWKLMPKSNKSFILRLFDDAIRLLILKVPAQSSEKVHKVLVDARNRVAVKLETLKVPPGSHDYTSLDSTVVKLSKTKQQLEQRLKYLTEAVNMQNEELEKLETERDQLLEFKSADSRHPLFTETFENELHLTFDTMR